ncbi:MAG: hypothetical protein WAT93_10695 [Pontixanthobacter sp.]
MTLSSSLFRNFGVLSISLLYTVLTFGAALTPTSAEAKAQSIYYTAELAAPAKEARTIARSVIWHCEDTQCVAAKDNSRAANTCKRLAREVGTITSFTAAGVTFSAEELAACNA